MAKSSCLARIHLDHIEMFGDALRIAGQPLAANIAHVDVAELGRLKPDFLICDIDGLGGDPLETLRQLRFVLPACLIVVYTFDARPSWILACHLAGASGIFSKNSDRTELASAIRGVLQSGCYTDPRFAAA